jgi:hypothetical protein
VIAFRAPDVRMLGGRDDVAVLWGLPGEVQLLWWKALQAAGASRTG